MKTVPRLISCFAISTVLAAGLTAHAVIILPANVENRTSVAVEITTVRMETTVGKLAITNEVKVTIRPKQHAPVILMPGSFAASRSFTRQIIIAQAKPPGEQPEIYLIAPPLVLDQDILTSARNYIVDIDPKTRLLTFQPTSKQPAK